WARNISSEVSFDSSEVLFLAHVEIFCFLRGEFSFSTWRFENFHVGKRLARGTSDTRSTSASRKISNL
ncbi:hypothetical protein, partial [Porphyromonas asaccharolytica]|uniref:hypothetical protein n=1 Tax=Porphyromonas asaccharolytica TaxID=28123 RepID=UPI00248EE43E